MNGSVRVDRTGVAAGAATPASGLTVRDVQVTYGGLVALASVSLDAPRGRVTGLVGPNGAGKTTLFNACAGDVQPNSGRVTLDGRDLSRLSPQRRAQLGLGRTFQRVELFDSLTVRENVSLGCEAGLAASSPWRQVIASPSERKRVEAATSEAVELCGIHELLERKAGNLTTGQRRLVEFARSLAGAYSVVMLDEPSSGLDEVESERFGALLRQVLDERDIGVLLVEHDMALVASVCERVYVLDFGQIIFEGMIEEFRTSDVVRASYLGAEV
jgi:ABC-type branched-subunit amino acid transport system ATPase component